MTRCNVLLKKVVDKKNLLQWAINKSDDFNGDESIQAINYFLYDFKDEVIQLHYHPITFKLDNIYIEELNDKKWKLVFEVEKSYTAFHDIDNHKIKVIPVNGGNLFELNYKGLEIDFKYDK